MLALNPVVLLSLLFLILRREFLHRWKLFGQLQYAN